MVHKQECKISFKKGSMQDNQIFMIKHGIIMYIYMKATSLEFQTFYSPNSLLILKA